MIGDIGKTRPNGSEQNCHALSSCCSLHAADCLVNWSDNTSQESSPKPDSSENTSRKDDKVTEIVPEWHPRKHRKGSVKLSQISFRRCDAFQVSRKLTVAPILPAIVHSKVSRIFKQFGHRISRPLIVITRPIKVLPSTQAPMAIFQLRPTAIMDEATSQLETAQASAIQYATYAPQVHVRLDGGMGSKSALDAFFVLAKLLSSWRTSRLNPGSLPLNLLTLPMATGSASTAEEAGDCFSIYACFGSFEAIVGNKV